MKNPNSPVVLFKSKLRLIKDKIACEGIGQIQLKWRPSSSTSFKMDWDIPHIEYHDLPTGPAKRGSAENQSLSFDVFAKKYS